MTVERIIDGADQETKVYDSVIVGAGISGLMAAHALKDFNILVIEKEARAGGRVLTRFKHNISYDLGAVFACDSRMLPSELENRKLIREDGPIGIFSDGKLHYGESVTACLEELDLSTSDLKIINEFRADPARDARTLPKHISRILEAFFQVIHPGEMEAYIPARQKDAFLRFDTSHYHGGNSEVIELFKTELGSNLRLSAKVLSVVETQDHVRVAFMLDHKRMEIFAKTVILTPPAPVALGMIDIMNDTCRSFLKSLRYESGTVVAICFQGAEFADFSYIVTPDLSSSTILKQHTADRDKQLLLTYYAGEKSARLQNLTAAQILGEAIDNIRHLGIGTVREENILFSDHCHWPLVGPIISDESYSSGWSSQAARPSQRVFLAGEYVHVSPPDILPYGLIPALLSGRKTAEEVIRFLRNEAFKSHYLVRSSRYELTAGRPIFRGAVEECDISFYGLLLQAEHDDNLRQYLLESARNSLWEWQSDFGVTSEDSALVLEGLLAAGVDRETLMPSLLRLVELFFSREDGAFRTILNGRAAYWKGPSIDATAQIGFLLQCIAPDIFPKEIEACAGYLQRTQHEQGWWRGKWFPSTMITTYYAIRLLCLLKHQYAEAVNKARQYTLIRQDVNGSWSDSVIETSAAILALNRAGAPSPVVSRAKKWLLKQKGEDGWKGEPVLYYWYEIAPDRKLFYHCVDKGRITTAWAKLALNSKPGGLAERDRGNQPRRGSPVA